MTTVSTAPSLPASQLTVCTSLLTHCRAFSCQMAKFVNLGGNFGSRKDCLAHPLLRRHPPGPYAPSPGPLPSRIKPPPSIFKYSPSSPGTPAPFPQTSREGVVRDGGVAQIARQICAALLVFRSCMGKTFARPTRISLVTRPPGFGADFLRALFGLEHRKISGKPSREGFFVLRESRVAPNSGDSPFVSYITRRVRKIVAKQIYGILYTFAHDPF